MKLLQYIKINALFRQQVRIVEDQFKLRTQRFPRSIWIDMDDLADRICRKIVGERTQFFKNST